MGAQGLSLGQFLRSYSTLYKLRGRLTIVAKVAVASMTPMVDPVAIAVSSVSVSVAMSVASITSVATIASITTMTSVASISIGSVGVSRYWNSGSDSYLSDRSGDSIPSGMDGMAGVVGSGSGMGRSGSGLVGRDVGAETVAIGDVLNNTDATIGVGQPVGADLVAPSVAGLLAEGAAAGVAFLVAEVVVAGKILRPVLGRTANFGNLGDDSVTVAVAVSMAVSSVANISSIGDREGGEENDGILRPVL